MADLSQPFAALTPLCTREKQGRSWLCRLPDLETQMVRAPVILHVGRSRPTCLEVISVRIQDCMYTSS